MPKQFITIQDASDLSKKSIQTIRRALKQKKLKYRKDKTPQGFNYLINYESLCECYGMKFDGVKEETAVKEETTIEKAEKVEEKKPKFVTTETFNDFSKTLERIITQHSDERQNFIRLISTMQEKIFVLENQLNLLKSPSKKWYAFWK